MVRDRKPFCNNLRMWSYMY